MKKKFYSVVFAFVFFVSVILGSCGDSNSPPNDATTETLPQYSEYPSQVDQTKPTFKDIEIIRDPTVETQPLNAPVSTAPQKKETRLSFLAAGDNLIHQNIIDDAKARATGDKGYNFLDMYSGVADIIKSADIALVNQESPIAGDEFKYIGYPNFNTPKECGYDLIELGFDVVTLANNHMLDKGAKGYQNSIDFWNAQQGILPIGGFKDKDDFEKIRILEKDGISIAFVAYTYGTNGMEAYMPKDSPLVIPTIDEPTLERQIKAAKEQADFVFAVMHWGNEDHFTPSQWQKSAAQKMVDSGVDVIIGMHPHVLQEMKWVDRPDGGKTLIAYSIGNFLSAMLYARNMLGGFMTFDIVKVVDGDSVTKSIENPQLVPFVTHYNMSRKGLQIYLFEDYTAELVKLHGCIKTDSKFSYDYLKNIVTDVISPEFLSDFFK